MLTLAAAAVVQVAACGARTGLESSPDTEGGGGDGATDGPPLEPPRDARPEVRRTDCVDAGIDAVFVVTDDAILERFDPPSATFAPIGHIACPGVQVGDAPNSMAVDRLGTAYVSYHDGSLYRVGTSDAACAPTAFVPGQNGWAAYGMGFTTVGGGPAEVLYVAETSYAHPSKGLATIDVSSLAFRFIGAFAPPLGNAVELTGTGDGTLYALSLDAPGPGSHLSRLDPTDAAVASSTALQIGSTDSALAFAAWGGDFYVFLSAAGGTGPTTVSRYHPADQSLTTIVTHDRVVVGAGVSTCATQ
jgi:hypothetical protein